MLSLAEDLPPLLQSPTCLSPPILSFWLPCTSLIPLVPQLTFSVFFLRLLLTCAWQRTSQTARSYFNCMHLLSSWRQQWNWEQPNRQRCWQGQGDRLVSVIKAHAVKINASRLPHTKNLITWPWGHCNGLTLKNSVFKVKNTVIVQCHWNFQWSLNKRLGGDDLYH